jgi:hypothetical protein
MEIRATIESMSDLKTTLNSLGLLLTMVGIYVVYHYSPLNFYEIDGGDAFTDDAKEKRAIAHRNRLLRVGVYVVIAGALLQLVSNFIPSSQ